MTDPMRRIPALLLGVTLLACTEPTTPVHDGSLALQESRSAERCINIEHASLTALGPWMLNGQIVPGAPPVAVSFGGVSGWLASVLDVQGMRVPGNSGTAHWTLTHYFLSDAPVPVDLGGGFVVHAVNLAAQSS